MIDNRIIPVNNIDVKNGGAHWGESRRSVVKGQPVHFTEQIVRQYLGSDDRFPVSLEDACQWIGYTEKRTAVRAIKRWMIDGVDFSTVVCESSGGRQAIEYRLTLDAFKQLCMMAETPKGRETRLYFIECEKRYWAIAQPSQTVSYTESLKPNWLVTGDTFSQLDLYPATHPPLRRPLADEIAADSYMSASELSHLLQHISGSAITLSPQTINVLLCRAGYHMPTNPDIRDPRWAATSLAQKFAIETGNHTRKWETLTILNTMFASVIETASATCEMHFNLLTRWTLETSSGELIQKADTRDEAIGSIVHLR